MDKFLTAIRDGFLKGVSTGWFLLKIMIPIYLIVVLVKYSPVMPWFERACAPAMKIFNLPPEAVVPIITGAFTDEYGVVAALGGFEFTTAAITTIAMITLTFHSIPVESAIARKIGLSPFRYGALRFITAVLIGVLTGWIGGVLI